MICKLRTLSCPFSAVILKLSGVLESGCPIDVCSISHHAPLQHRHSIALPSVAVSLIASDEAYARLSYTTKYSLLENVQGVHMCTLSLREPRALTEDSRGNAKWCLPTL